MEAIKVAGEVESFCSACKQMKDHVVVAVVDGVPAKVECMGCHRQHGYRPHLPGASKPPRSARPRAEKVRAAKHEPAGDLLAKLDAAERNARPYSPRTRFAIDDGVSHPTFGVGVVLALPGPQKIEVAFRQGKRLLVHDRG
jgi:hypothetical protein